MAKRNRRGAKGARKRRQKPRPFRPKALSKFGVPAIRPRTSGGAHVYRYMAVVPLEEIKPRYRVRATPEDLEKIEATLAKDFGGFTTLPRSSGFGLRDPESANGVEEMNYNMYYVIYSAPILESDAYFRALQNELVQALGEGVILIEKQLVTLV
jgi:hypothetical protein